MHRLLFDKRIIFWLFIIFINGSHIYAQSFSINYTAKDGLENENITAITEDHNGYIYVGSASGVMLFDGVSFTPFYKNGTGSLPENVFVYDLVFDQANNLWIWSELDGIYHWDRSKNHWTNFSNSSETGHKLQSNELTGITSIDSLFYFSGQRQGLNTINIFDLSLSINIDNSKNTYSDFDILDDILILNGHQTLYSFVNGELSPIAKSKQYSLVDTEIFKDKIFLSKYESGLFLLENGDLKSLGINKIADPWRTKILGLIDGSLYVTCKNSGLLSYHIGEESWQFIESKPYDSNSLIKAKYNGGLIDSRGIIWVATSKGISCFNPKLQGFQKIENKKEITDYLLDARYHEKSKSYVTLYSSSADKVKIYDQKFQLKSSYNHRPDTEGITSIFDLMEYKDDLYAVSFQLFQIDARTGICTTPKDNFLRSLSNVRAANIDNDGNLWSIHNNDILSVYNLDTRQKILEKKLPLIGDASEIRYRINNIHFDDHSAFIAAGSVFFEISKSDYDIQIFAIEKGELKMIKTHPSQVNKIEKVFAYKNNIYISSRNDGIFKTKFDPFNSSFKILNQISTRDLYSPIDFDFDDQGNIWVASDNGLVLLDGQLRIVKKYDSQNGLSNTKLTTGLSITNNKIFLMGEGGILVGDPKLLQIKNNPQKVDISQFEVNGKNYSASSEGLEFPYSQKNISVKLSMPIYGSNSDYEYQYRLLGSNEEWKSRPFIKNELNYENLNPSTYTFEVKSVVGHNESEVSRVQFEIKPPFWNTSYFVLLVLALIALMFTLFYKYKVKKKVEKERINTLLSQLENTAIRSQLNPHFIFNSLNSIRSMILLDRKQDSVQYLEQFSDMIREVLQMSKEEKVTLDHEISFNRNYLEIEKLRFSDKFNFSFNIEEGLNINHILVPPLIIQPFVENAIWHGLLHNNKESILNIDIKNIKESLHIIIDDNGIGREKSKLLQKSSIKKTKKNLGVSLSKKRISMLGKNANVEIIDKYQNNNPAGTTVHIVIPLSYAR